MKQDNELSVEEIGSFKELSVLADEINEVHEVYSDQMEEKMGNLGFKVRGILKENIQLKEKVTGMKKISYTTAQILLRELELSSSIDQIKDIIRRVIEEMAETDNAR